MQAVRFTPHILVSSVLGGFAITARVARGAAAAAGEWRAVARAAAHAWGVAWAALAGDLAAPDDPAAAAAVALWHLPLRPRPQLARNADQPGRNAKLAGQDDGTA